MTNQRPKSEFVHHLQTMAANPRRRGDLAHLRRGLGRPPGTVAEMYPHVIGALPDGLSEWDEQMHYLIATLFALHPDSAWAGNMGTHFAELGNPKEPPSEALERRFITLLNARPENLYRILPPIVNRFKAAGVPICWGRLLADLQQWKHPASRRRVRKRWADSFWKRTTQLSAAAPYVTASDTQTQDQI
jgi:CRISPR system Cascade subunit CasB